MCAPTYHTSKCSQHPGHTHTHTHTYTHRGPHSASPSPRGAANILDTHSQTTPRRRVPEFNPLMSTPQKQVTPPHTQQPYGSATLQSPGTDDGVVSHARKVEAGGVCVCVSLPFTSHNRAGLPDNISAVRNFHASCTHSLYLP